MRLSDLIEYVIDDPLPDLDPRSAASFPFLASEMLTDSGEVLDLFFREGIYLEQFFAFLRKPEVNPTSAGYFSQVAQSLLARNAAKVVEFLFLVYDYRRDFLRHIGCRPIAELLWKLIRCEPGLPHFTYDKLSLIEALCAFINDSASALQLSHTSQLLTDLMASRDLKGWRVYMALLMQDKVATLWCLGLRPENPALCCTAAKLLAGVLMLPDYDALSKINYEEVDRAIRKQLGRPQKPVLEPVDTSPVPPLLRRLLPLLPSLVDELAAACYPGATLCQWRFSLFNLISALLFVPQAATHLIESAAVPTAVDLFQAQLWPTLFHNAFETFVHRIVEGGDLQLRKELIVRAGLPQVLAEIAQEPCVTTANKCKTRKGYMGHVTRIGNYLLESDLLLVMMEELKSDPRWGTFVREFLTPQTRLESKKLGDAEAESDSSEEFNDDTEDLYHELATALTAQLQSTLDQCSEFSTDSSEFQPYTYWRLAVPAHALEDLD